MDTKETTFQLVNLPKFLDERGNLSFIEAKRQVPFDIARSYWIYDVPGGETRGGHSYYQNEELIVALSGSFDVVIDDLITVCIFQKDFGVTWKIFPPMHWRLC
jgi:hypothetical protein